MLLLLHSRSLGRAAGSPRPREICSDRFSIPYELMPCFLARLCRLVCDLFLLPLVRSHKNRLLPSLALTLAHTDHVVYPGAERVKCLAAILQPLLISC